MDITIATGKMTLKATRGFSSLSLARKPMVSPLMLAI